MGKLPEGEKAVRYISQLDEARCAGRWGDVPELCRKVEKHAPQRRCLTLTARSEAQIAAYGSQRPSTAASTSSGLSKIIPTLLTAIEEERDHVQDAFQATVCLGWLHYVLEEPGLAVARLPKDFPSVVSDLTSQGEPLSGWSRVCVVKGAFLKGSSQDRTGAVEEAIQTYSSIIPWLASLGVNAPASPLFKSWTERLLVRLCQLVDQSSETGEYVETDEALQVYRFWAKFWESTGAGAGTESMAQPRRSAWKAYYCTLSMIIEHDLPYSPISASVEADATVIQTPNAKFHQRAELKRVENIYEAMLLKETSFPRASDSNQEIEEWTNAVIANWRFLCGPAWTDEDLGEGGKEAVGRGVLDILYRAAAKTFHSTTILRHLFTIHAWLAEFELAFKAYDSYVEIIDRGKARAEKSGEQDVGIDDDSVILRTSAEAIRILCRFGSRKEAEKAVQIGDQIEKWLEQTQHVQSDSFEAGSLRSPDAVIPPAALAGAYCAIGLSQAQWARYTYNANTRARIQTKAVQYLRKSLEPHLGDPGNLEALYSLGLVLAEMRDIPGAIKVVKRALSSQTRSQTGHSGDDFIPSGLRTEFARERKLLPAWHLLALLLTARSEYSAAEKACEAAFQQFGDPVALFGGAEEDAAYRSEHLKEANGNASHRRVPGIVDQMDSFEKNGILQVKMTQLALVEVVEGPGLAVDGCDELLALYARLFGGELSSQRAKLQPPSNVVAPPKSAVGTVRGSIFRSKGSVKSSTKDTVARNPSIASSRPSTTATRTTAAPTIQVTDETGTDSANKHAHHHHHHHLFHHKHEGDKQGVVRTPSKLQKRSGNSLRRKSAQEAEQATVVSDRHDRVPNDASTHNPRRPSMSSSVRKSIESSDRPLRTKVHNTTHAREPLPTGHLAEPAKHDRLAPIISSIDYVPPEPRFSSIQSRRHNVSLLVDIWIFISGLYTRAGMHEDAAGAVSEALKLVDEFEAEVAQLASNSRSFANRGWGGGKSVEELWADAFSARGETLSAQALKHEGKADFERALLHCPDHGQAIVGLSNILLDIYAGVIPLEPAQYSDLHAPFSPPSVPPATHIGDENKKQHLASHTPSAENQIAPPDLNRLAARDRAYGLLSTLTKLGAGWDYSEAWYALARAYEESGQPEKAKEVLWWCVELEDTHPVRGWKSVTVGGVIM